MWKKLLSVRSSQEWCICLTQHWHEYQLDKMVRKTDYHLHCCNGRKTGRICSNLGDSGFQMSCSLCHI